MKNLKKISRNDLKKIIGGLDDLRDGKFWIFPWLFPIAACSLGFSLIPQPVKLDLYIGKPIVARKGETSLQFAARPP